MIHLTENQIKEAASLEGESQEISGWDAHINMCDTCRRRWVEALLPSVRFEKPLSADEKEEIFRSLMQADQTRKVISFKRGLAPFFAAGLAVAAALLLILIPEKQDPVAVGPLSPNGQKDITTTASRLALNKIEGAVTINGARYADPATLADDHLEISTAAGESGELALADIMTLHVREKSSATLVVVDKQTISVQLKGSVRGWLNHAGNHNLIIEVPGGTYQVIGTIFHILADSLQSSIKVIEGAVAYIARYDAQLSDTVFAGEEKTFPVAPPHALVRKTHATGGKKQVSVAENKYFDPNGNINKQGNENIGDVDANQMNELQRAKMLIQQGNSEQALPLLKKALATNSRNEALLWHGYAYERMENYDSALFCFDRASAINMPKQVRAAALQSIGRLSSHLGDMRKAAIAYRKYLVVAPRGSDDDRSRAYQFLINHLTKNGDIDEQVTLLEEWIDEMPDLDTPMYLLATAYREKNDFRYAIRYFETYILKYPRGEWIEDAYYWAAQCHRKLGQNQEYEKKVQQYRTRFPDGQRLSGLSKE